MSSPSAPPSVLSDPSSISALSPAQREPRFCLRFGLSYKIGRDVSSISPASDELCPRYKFDGLMIFLSCIRRKIIGKSLNGSMFIIGGARNCFFFCLQAILLSGRLLLPGRSDLFSRSGLDP